MRSPRRLHVKKSDICHSSGHFTVDTEEEHVEVKAVHRCSGPRETFCVGELWNAAWCGWFVVYTFVLFCFSVSRSLALRALVSMYSNPEDYTSGFKRAALALGFLEDFVCSTYFVTTLWLFDTLKHAIISRFSRQKVTVRVVCSIATFVVSWFLFFVMMAPFVADLLLVVYRDMRFTFDLMAALVREKKHLKAAPISSDEVHRAYAAAALLMIVAVLFASVRTRASWADLSEWNPTHIVSKPKVERKRSIKVNHNKMSKGVKYLELSLEETPEILSPNTVKGEQSAKQRVLTLLVPLAGLVVVPAIVVSISATCSPLVAYSGLNATLNELFRHALQPAPKDITPSHSFHHQPWVETYIHRTEKHELFDDDSLSRRTTGFRGDLAFNVSIANDNPPNVLIIGVESFRFQDSRYLVGEDDPSDLFKGTDLTITPNFDKWAKRGVALRNIWSSSPTSRSLESLLYAQIPYNSAVKTGITGGRKDTKLSGLPHLFSAKGYETYFTTGSSITLDNWDVFLPTHGFETVWDNHKISRFAENNHGIKNDQWYGKEHRGFIWGVHDDLSFQVLGDLLVNKTHNQTERVANGEPKKPLFITHYTISSHSPFDAWPHWYSEVEKPDFSALYEGHKHAGMIKNYLEIRYFTDMELGKFMDRMAAEGVLNDTIVVIMGDHGQAPEADITNTHEESITRVAAAIIAEGRLGNSTGLVIEDATEQYDILNTLADITGLPESGFLQTGVGRSLKRKVPFGERVVFSNDPSRKMSIVRGNKRLRYDSVTDAMMLHDTEVDHAMGTNLFPLLSDKEKAEWEKWRDDGRSISAYFTTHWDENCLIAVNCTTGG